MEPSLLLRDVVERSRVRGVYLCTHKALARGRTDRAYLSLTLSDRSGTVDARVWDHAEQIAGRFAELDLVRVDGVAVAFQGRLQLHVSEVARVDDPALDPTDFMPASEHPVEQSWEGLLALVGSVANPHLRALLDAVLGDPELARAFKRCPAAKSIHHARVGGLLEHTLSVARLVDVACTHYAQEAPGLCDRDLAVAAALLHDVGKTRELMAGHGFTYTDQGRLLGHIVLGDAIIEERLRALPEFPADLALRLRHVLLAHHGQLEYGSPKRPKTVEAFLVHHADALDCQLGFLRDLHAREAPARWSSYQKVYDRYFLLGLDGDDADANGAAAEGAAPGGEGDEEG